MSTPWPPAVQALTVGPADPPVDCVFDMDGTLLDGDLGDEMVGWLLAAGHRPAWLLSQVGDHAGYVDATRGWDTPHQFLLCAAVLEGLTAAQVDEAAAACIAAHIRLREPIVALARAMAAAGHRVWILTGSAEPLGQAVAGMLGLSRDRVVGLRLDRADGRFLPRALPPITCGPGKVDACRARIGPSPGFAIGDAHTDIPILSAAAAAVAVPPPGGRLIAAAADAGIPVRLPADLGEPAPAA